MNASELKREYSRLRSLIVDRCNTEASEAMDAPKGWRLFLRPCPGPENCHKCRRYPDILMRQFKDAEFELKHALGLRWWEKIGQCDTETGTDPGDPSSHERWREMNE